MTSPLISATRNAPKTISESVIDIPIDEENHWHQFTLAERNVSDDLNRLEMEESRL